MSVEGCFNVGLPLFPSWLPLLSVNTAPLLYADFAANNYWYSGNIYGSFASWLTAIGGAFSRSSTAYRTNASGLLESVASNALRFDYDPVIGARTNLVLNSNTFSSWQAFNASIAQNVMGPDGIVNSGWTMTGDATTGTHAFFSARTTTLTDGTVYTFSIYLKAGTAGNVFLNVGSYTVANNWFTAVFNLGGGGVVATQTATGASSGTISGTSMVSVGNGWFRCSITGTANNITTTGDAYVEFGYAPAATGNTFDTAGEVTGAAPSLTVLAYGAQLERSSSATAYIPSAGSPGIVAAPKGILMEGASTNLYFHSQEFDDPSWPVGLGVLTVTANASIAPDGTTTADNVAHAAADGNSYMHQDTSLAAATTYTKSVYAKAVSGDGNIAFESDLNDGGPFRVCKFDVVAGTVVQAAVGTASIVNVGNGWYRLVYTATTVGASARMNVWYINSGYFTSTTGTIALWGAQLEALSFVSSYVPTTTTQLTRAADFLDATPSTPFFNGTAFSLFGVGTPEESYPGTGSTDFSPLIQLDNNNSNYFDNIGLDFNNQHVGTEGMEAYVIAGNVNQFVARPMGSSVIAGTQHKLMMAGQANDFAATADGLTPTTQASGSLPNAGNIFHISIGFGTGNTGPYWGTIKQLGYWNARGSNADLQRITT